MKVDECIYRTLGMHVALTHHSPLSTTLLTKGPSTNSIAMAETLHQWDYLFAFGVIFCALDAYNIGANE